MKRRQYGTPCDQIFNILNIRCNLLKTIQLYSKRCNMVKTHRPAFVNIICPDIEECMLVRICVCMLMRFCRSLPSHLKGITYGEGETPCHVIHTTTTWNLCLMKAGNLGFLSIGHEQRVIYLSTNLKKFRVLKKRIT